MGHIGKQCGNGEMVKCLADCGVQFRWITCGDLDLIFHTLFHINDLEDSEGTDIVWKGPNCAGTGRVPESRQYRRKSVYHGKQKMLEAVISAGAPRDLLLPTIDISLDEQLMEDAKAKGTQAPDREMTIARYGNFSRIEKKARALLGPANSKFNAAFENDTKNDTDFYKQLLDMWEKQSMPQKARLDEFELADPRWRKHCKNNEQAFEPWWLTRYDPYDSSDDDGDY